MSIWHESLSYTLRAPFPHILESNWFPLDFFCTLAVLIVTNSIIHCHNSRQIDHKKLTNQRNYIKIIDKFMVHFLLVFHWRVTSLVAAADAWVHIINITAVRHILPGTHVVQHWGLCLAPHIYIGKWSNQTNVNIQSLQLHLSALESTCRTVPYKAVNAVIAIASSGTRVVSRDHCVRVSTRLCRWCVSRG